MPMTTVVGVYRGGRVELSEGAPVSEEGAQVLVTFLPSADERTQGANGSRERLLAQILSDMRRGIDFGGPPYPRREELHPQGATAQRGGEGEREALRQAAFARMRAGLPLGGPPYPRRETLYDRHDR